MQPNSCYGQDGEDLILNRLLEGKALGFYVDVGAHHPARFSNTYLFYKRGWFGINIDAMPGSMKKFNQIRPRDTNIECGVAGRAGKLNYYRFNEPALNTFDAAEAERKNKPPYRLLDIVQVEVERLDVLLRRYVPPSQQIDFLSVDVEGKDEEVLRSNDWSCYRPRFILAETLRADMLVLGDCSVVQFLSTVGYKPVGKAYNTTFFVREQD
ncbi:FkbM family methyltransferase [Rhodoferax saidenbachensis]|uniref:FkbM family methyltransferase n=1 Tax=Rhodoferax saidenbachensis TaxID=1484693 RepID=A0ABU1ZKG0_9BURK|nr:FkbM family methyltransferase [Rhodoferax saidenbachensis]MDR7306029.1 FkbM family methyltransferase [Rhodoferax saidenbachensis]